MTLKTEGKQADWETDNQVVHTDQRELCFTINLPTRYLREISAKHNYDNCEDRHETRGRACIELTVIRLLRKQFLESPLPEVAFSTEFAFPAWDRRS